MGGTKARGMFGALRARHTVIGPNAPLRLEGAVFRRVPVLCQNDEVALGVKFLHVPVERRQNLVAVGDAQRSPR